MGLKQNFSLTMKKKSFYFSLWLISPCDFWLPNHDWGIQSSVGEFEFFSKIMWKPFERRFTQIKRGCTNQFHQMTSLSILKLTVDNKVHPFLIYLFEVHHKCTQIQCLKSINVFFQARTKFEIFLEIGIWVFSKWSKLKFLIFEIGLV